ncbi:hypothetical protein SRABI80_00799 [Peribacillus frigoritolerans]|uniref:hypothetical protein n=1 Tax=Peribacillus frigoritolerans TaxID=450367 RepID=UPI001DB06BDD|nr:hypothetical protein SRABI80_00799 [Peribacillus frigoritolerans]
MIEEISTFLPNNWLAGTPQALPSRKLSRQSAVWEWISESNWSFLNLSTVKRTEIIQSFLDEDWVSLVSKRMLTLEQVLVQGSQSALLNQDSTTTIEYILLNDF